MLSVTAGWSDPSPGGANRTDNRRGGTEHLPFSLIGLAVQRMRGRLRYQDAESDEPAVVLAAETDSAGFDSVFCGLDELGLDLLA